MTAPFGQCCDHGGSERPRSCQPKVTFFNLREKRKILNVAFSVQQTCSMQKQDDCLVYLVRESNIITQFPLVLFLRLNNGDPLTPPLESEHQIWDLITLFFITLSSRIKHHNVRLVWIVHLIQALTFILTHIQNPFNHRRAFHLPRMSSGQFSAGGPQKERWN